MADDMGDKGIDAANLSYKYRTPIVEDIVARAKADAVSYQIVIIGHSVGGKESSKFANYLESLGVRVELVVALIRLKRATSAAISAKSSTTTFQSKTKTIGSCLLPAFQVNSAISTSPKIQTSRTHQC